MLGLMQEWPLLCQKILDHAAIAAPERAVVSRSVEGAMHRTTYRALRERALRLAKRLDTHGIGLGDRCATLAWNTWRHLEIWYGTSGLGAGQLRVTDFNCRRGGTAGFDLHLRNDGSRFFHDALLTDMEILDAQRVPGL